VNVVSDSSPLIALAAIDSLDLLRALYGSINIPDEVFNEVVVRGRYPATAIANTPWIIRRTVKDVQQVAQFRDAGLDHGESEAITLALELPASLLLVDELAARKIARQLGLAITVVVGVLIDAKDAGLIVAIKPLLGKLVAAGFYCSPRLIAQASELAGE
jgi:predicted nucleic acid-binding protein